MNLKKKEKKLLLFAAVKVKEWEKLQKNDPNL